MISLNSTKFNSFLSCDLDRNQKQDFLIGVNEKLLWVYYNGQKWDFKTVFFEGLLQTELKNIVNSTSNDLVLLHKDYVSWALEVNTKGKFEGFTFEANGETLGFHEFVIDLEQEFKWSKFRITVGFI